MKNTIFFFLLTVSMVSVAQEAKKSSYMPQMMYGIGVTFQSFEGLDSRIASFPQYKELSEHMATLHLGWLKQHNQVVSGLAFTAGTSMSGDKNKRSSNLRFYGFSADLGYDVLKNELIMLYPIAGIGFEKYQARFFKDNSSVEFNNVLQSAIEQSSLGPVDFKNSFLTYRLGAGFALKNRKNPSHSIGVQAGYISSFKDHDWKTNENQELKNAPEDGLNRLYINLTFMCQPKFKRG